MASGSAGMVSPGVNSRNPEFSISRQRTERTRTVWGGVYVQHFATPPGHHPARVLRTWQLAHNA
jgi:hypothetical protein